MKYEIGKGEVDFQWDQQKMDDCSWNKSGKAESSDHKMWAYALL